MALSKNQLDSIKKVISDPIHGREFYTSKTYSALLSRLNYIVDNNVLNISEHSTQKNICDCVKKYLISILHSRKEYTSCYENETPLPESEIPYRTAYAVLIKHQAVCPGYTEAARILLECYGVQTKTLQAALPEEWRKVPHFTCLAHITDENVDKFILVDPEREGYCFKKNIDYIKYKAQCLYFNPPQISKNNKMSNFGVGPLINEIKQEQGVKIIKGDGNFEELWRDDKYTYQEILSK